MEARGMQNIVLIRVDDRLVHGQVMTSWCKATNANKIMVVDDGVAAEPLMKTVLKGVVPAQISWGSSRSKRRSIVSSRALKMMTE